MTKGLFPPAPVNNAPSQFGRGTQTNCRRMKMKKGIISLRSQAKPSQAHSSSSSTSSAHHLSHKGTVFVN